jgi:hypothetical protein
MRKWILKYENPLELHMKSREQVLKAVRKVKSNGFTAIGKLPSAKNGAMVQYESSLEEDFASVLEFNIGVIKYVEQPVKIEFKNESGKQCSYTPDFVAFYRKDRQDYKSLPPQLFEVKRRQDIKRSWVDLKPKFIAALKFADKKGWKFKIITEQEIYSPYFINAKFLLPYMRQTPEIGLVNTILDTLEYLDSGTPSEILAVASNDLDRKITLIPALWYLIGQRMIGCDLNNKLTMESDIWYIEN